MTDRNKFEEMLERLINEDREGAEELFHEIVVERSRDIYESLLSEETDEEVDEATDEEVDESEEDDLDESADEEVDESEEDDLEESEEDDLDEMFGLDEFEVEADPMDMGGDATDDMMADLEGGDEGEEGEEGEGPESAMDNLEDALEALKAEFEKLMGGEGEEEPEADDEEGEEEPEEEAMAFEAEESDDEEEVEESRTPKTAGEQMREYVEKVTAKMGDNGANTKSTVAGPNNMGGTSANIVKGGTADEKGTGAKAPKEDSAGNVNVPGGKAAKSMTSAKAPAKGDNGANAKSIIGGK